MAGRLNVKTTCKGGDSCPLKLPVHPEASKDSKKSRFALGCSLCRSEKLEIIADNADGATGANVERRGSMLKKFGGVHGHDINREMRVERGGVQAPPQKPVPPPNIKCCSIF